MRHEPLPNASDNYTEYRQDLMKYILNYSSMDNNDKHTLIEDVFSSKDIQKLILQEGMIQYVDQIGGIPKICMTLGVKYLKHKTKI